MKINQRFENALWCLAVGDAVGDVFEFKNKSQFTPDNIIQYANGASALKITDDTQMTLFTADALLDFRRSGKIHEFGKEELVRPFFENSYVDWYTTQYADDFYEKPGLTSFKVLNHQRAPGYTCLNSCDQLLKSELVTNSSKGCGAVMRILPCFLIPDKTMDGFDDFDYTLAVARISGNVTHKHPEIAPAIDKLMHAYRCAFVGYENFHTIENISKIRTSMSISDLGEGWTAMECVEMAIWAAMKATDFDDLLIKSIWHSGDSDSVAAVACSIWGLSGKEVPIKYKNKILEKEPIQYIIDQIK